MYPLLLITLSLFTASSSAAVFPLKSLVCEASLSPQMEYLSEPDGKEAHVRAAALRLQARLPKDLTDAGTTYESVAFAGRAARLNPTTATELRARLNAVYSDLMDSNLDAQKVILVFRGANYARAVDRFAKCVEEFGRVYERQILDVNPSGPRYLGYGVRGAYVAVMAKLGVNLFNSIGSIYPGLVTSNMMYIGALSVFLALPAMVEVPRRDLRHVPLLRALRRIGMANDKDQMLVRGYAADFSAAFVSHVLDPHDESGRDEQLAEDGPGFVAKFTGDFPAGRAWTDTRRVFVDHVAYVDQRSNEPVWVVTMRSFRVHPTPRKPTRQPVERPAAAWDLLPGANR